jgi:hypothetical protein
MTKLIVRDRCLKEYPDFPLQSYNEAEDHEFFIYPEVISGPWIRMDLSDDSDHSDALARELTELISAVGVKSLIFLGDTEQSWLTSLSLQRNDYQPLAAALAYFITLGVEPGFNGGIEVSISDLQTFLIHFYSIVRCDASLPYIHFIDNYRQIIGIIRYSGDVRLDRFTEEADKRLEQLVNQSSFRPAAT